MDADQPQNFNDRLSQWIASQGFWFQLRYSMSGGGGWSVALFHLLKLGARLAIVAVIAALVVAFIMSKRLGSEDFREDLGERFAATMSASAAEIDGFSRDSGKAKIKRIGAEGSSSCFFETLEAGNLSFNMGMLDGVTGTWEAGVIEGNWIDIHVKAGANSPEEASAAAATLFDEHPGFSVRGAVFTNARVTWGYGRRLGEIDGSAMTATRVSEGWRFSFKGGTFRQNWLRDLEIEELIMLCTPTGLIVERSRLTLGSGEVRFEGVKVDGGELPEIRGVIVLDGVPFEDLIPEQFGKRVTGELAMDLNLSGSTNTREGIQMQGRVELGGKSFIQLRDEFPILEALDVVDVFNSYKRTVFSQGSFELKAGDGKVELSDIEIEAREFMGLRGRIMGRFPTEEEAVSTVGDGGSGVLDPLMVDSEESESSKDITLKQAGKVSKEGQNSEEARTNEFFASLANMRDEESLQRAAAQRLLGMLVFSGELELLLPGDAFEHIPTLTERYSRDDESGRFRLKVPLNGTLPELTLEEAERLLDDGRKKRD